MNCRLHLTHIAIVTAGFALTIAGWSAEPAEELASFKLASGYEANLFASETDGVAKPIQIRFDAQGRLWAACSTIYPQPQPGQKPEDKIVVLEDADGDGRAERSTVFADDLLIPTGLEFGDGGLYVGQATELLHLRDRNGDLRADERRVLLRGFGTGDTHQNINSFCWSPGGQLFMSQGLHAFSNVETPYGVERLHEAGLWRFTPRESRLEPFLGNGVAPHNPWGFVWDDWFAPFMVAGNGHGIYWLSPILVRTEHRHEFQKIFRDGPKYCGTDIVGTRHLPDSLQGKLIAGGFMNNRIVVLRFEDDGAGFALKEEEPLLVSSNVSFRPVDVKIGPDGAIYVADWYNPIIGHYQNSFRDPRRDKTHGRIWRITAKGRAPAPRVKLADLSVSQLLDQLKSGERWVRYQARRVLAERNSDEVLRALKSWSNALAPDDLLHERHLLEGLSIYETLDAPQPELLARLLMAADPRARAYATEVIGRWHERLSDPLASLTRSATDRHPCVRLQAVVAASRVPHESSIEVALAATDQPVDRFLNDALIQTVHALKPHWLPAFTTGRLNLANHPNQLEFLLKTDASADTLRVTVERLRDSNLNRGARGSLLNVLALVGGAAELRLLLESASFNAGGEYDPALQARLIPTLATAQRVRELRPSGVLAAALQPLLASPHEPLRAEALKLAGVWKLESLRDALEIAAQSGSESETIRRAAIEGIAAFGGNRSRSGLITLATASPTTRLRAAAINSLTSLDLSAAATNAAAFLRQPIEDALAAELFSTFLARQKGPATLAAALREQAPTADAAKIGLRQMSAAGRNDETLVGALTDAAGLAREAKPFSPEEISALVSKVRSEGDAARGAKVYARPELSCVTCHAINGQGGDIGPDLSALGTAQPVEFIIGAVLDPNREVKEGYTAFEFTTKSGDLHQGYIVREGQQEVVLRDIALKQEVTLRKAAIGARTQRGSVMPPGLADTLTRAELMDLIRFLSELGRASR